MHIHTCTAAFRIHFSPPYIPISSHRLYLQDSSSLLLLSAKWSSRKGNLDHVRVYRIHSLKGILHTCDDEASDLRSAQLIVLEFEYLWKLNVIRVGIDSSHEESKVKPQTGKADQVEGGVTYTR